QVQTATTLIGYNAGSTGSVLVTGAGSHWINTDMMLIGNGGISGTLRVEAGGSVSSTSGRVGAFTDGTATVTGVGSSWTVTGALDVGHSATSGVAAVGTLEILDGGVVTSAHGWVSHHGDGNVLVEGAGSRWDIAESFLVGIFSDFGGGQVTIRNGGALSSGRAVIGGDWAYTPFGGEVRVEGSGSRWTNAHGLQVGGNAQGTLTIADGGWVGVGGVFDLGLGADAIGVINIGAGGAAGVLDAASIIGGAGSATLNFNHDEANYFFTSD